MQTGEATTTAAGKPVIGHAEVSEDVAAQAQRSAGQELDRFIARLGLASDNETLAMGMATAIRSCAAQMAAISVQLGRTSPDFARALQSAALAIALKSAELEKDTISQFCPCPDCAAKRGRALGWRHRMRMRLIGWGVRFRRMIGRE